MTAGPVPLSAGGDPQPTISLIREKNREIEENEDMERTRKLLCMALTLCLLLGWLPVPAHASGLPFTDIDEGDWYYDAVRYVYEQKLMDGTDGAAFSPDGVTSRGMVVTVLHRMEGCPAAADAGFTDVPAGQWYSGGANWAAAVGVVGGYGDGRFGPEDGVTREQLAAILYRYCGCKGYDTSLTGAGPVFSDAGDISDYAVEAVAWAAANGILSGREDGSLAPGLSASRAEVAAVLTRFHQSAFLPAVPALPEEEPPVHPALKEPGPPSLPAFYPAEPELPAETVPELPPETPPEGIRIFRGGEVVTGGEVRPGDTLSASAGGSAADGIRWTVSGRSVSGGVYTVSPLDMGETIAVTAPGREAVFVTVSRQTAFHPGSKDDGPVSIAAEAAYYAAYPDRPISSEDAAGMLLTVSPVQAEQDQLEAAKAQMQAALSETPSEIHAVDLSLLLTGDAAQTPVHPLGETVVTLNRAALGLPEDVSLRQYVFAACRTGIDGQSECVYGEPVSVDGGSYVRFVLTGLGRLWIGRLPVFIVQFDAAGGSPTPAPQTVRAGGQIEAAAPPVREGWLFAGWTPITDAVTENMTLTARWLQCLPAPAAALSGSWEQKDRPVDTPAHVEERVSDGTVTLALDSDATYLAGLRYRLELAAPEGAVKYASARSPEEAAASTQYLSLEKGDPLLTAEVTDGSGNILSGGALYVKWIDASGEALRLQSVRLEITQASGSPTDPLVPSPGKTVPVDRGLGRVSACLTGESLPDYEGDMTFLPDVSGAMPELTASFCETFRSAEEGSAGAQVSAGDYDTLKLRIAPFQGAPALGKPSVSVMDIFGEPLTFPTEISQEGDAAVVLCRRFQEQEWPEEVLVSVSLDDQTQNIRIVFPANQPVVKPQPQWKITGDWAKALTYLEEGQAVRYTGSAAVLSETLTLGQGQALDMAEASLTIASGGSLTVSSLESCQIFTNKITVEEGGKLEIGGTLEIYPGVESGGMELAGDITMKDGHLSVYCDLTVAATGSVTCNDEYGSTIFIDGGLYNGGKLSLTGDINFSGNFENRGTLSIDSGSYLILSGTETPLRNTGNMTIGGDCTLTLLGAALVNSGHISGGGKLSCLEQTVILEYDSGIEWAEQDDSLPTSPGNYGHFRFARDPAATADIRVFAGDLSSEDGGSCTLTDGGNDHS